MDRSAVFVQVIAMLGTILVLVGVGRLWRGVNHALAAAELADHSHRLRPLQQVAIEALLLAQGLAVPFGLTVLEGFE